MLKYLKVGKMFLKNIFFTNIMSNFDPERKYGQKTKDEKQSNWKHNIQQQINWNKFQPARGGAERYLNRI